MVHELGFEFIAFNKTIRGASCPHALALQSKAAAEGRRIILDIVRGAKGTPGLEPAPITPSDTESFELIGSTIKKVFGDDVVVAPSAVSAAVTASVLSCADRVTLSVYRCLLTLVSPVVASSHYLRC